MARKPCLRTSDQSFHLHGYQCECLLWSEPSKPSLQHMVPGNSEDAFRSPYEEEEDHCSYLPMTSALLGGWKTPYFSRDSKKTLVKRRWSLGKRQCLWALV